MTFSFAIGNLGNKVVATTFDHDTIVTRGIYEHQDGSRRHLFMNHVCIKRLGLLRLFNKVLFLESSLAVPCL